MNSYLQNFISKKFAEPAKALDLGAGKFLDVKGLNDLGWKAVGVDIIRGVDLEKPFLANDKPFDLVYSNYLIHSLKNTEIFVQTIYDNLKNSGWFFIHTFDKSDENSKSTLSKESITKLFTSKGFIDVEVGLFNKWDVGHKHWHKVLEITGQKI